MKKFTQLMLLAGLAALFSLIPGLWRTGSASAHAAYVRSNPAANATLPAGQPLTQIQIWYTEEVEIKFSKLEVRDKDGKPIDKGDTRLAPGDAKSMVVSLAPNLPDGPYTVISTAASALDGHSVTSSFAFVVGVGALPSGTTISSSPLDAALANRTDIIDNSAANFWSVGLRWLNYLAAVGLVGGLLFYLLIWRNSVSKVLKKGRIGAEIATADRAVTSRSQQLISIMIGALALSWLGWLFYQTAYFSGQSLGQLLGFGGGRGLAALSDFLFNSRYGLIWLVRLGLIAIAAIIWFVIRPRAFSSVGQTKFSNPSTANPQLPTSNPQPNLPSITYHLPIWWAVFGVGLAILLTNSLNSHAAALPDFAPLAVFNDWLHLVGTCFWIGGLVFIALTLPLAFKVFVPGTGDKTRLLAVLAPNFSQMAILSVALLGITGVINAALQLGDFNNLWNTSYGVALLIKLGLFGLLLMLGFINQQI